MTNQSEIKALESIDRSIDDRVVAGRITSTEAAVMKAFFRTPTRPDWPMSALQRRMQS